MGSPAVLDDNDVSQLVSALERFARRFPEPRTRLSVLGLALAGATCPVACTGDETEFSLELAAWLNDQPVKVEEVDRHPLMRLLAFFKAKPASYGFLPEDVDLFNQLLRAFKGRAKQAGTAARLRGEMARTALVLSRTYKIDRDILLLEFDLQAQVRAFAGRLQPPNSPRGVVTLTAGGPISFFLSYVRPRLLQYLERDLGLTDVACPDYEWIDNGDVTDPRYVAVADSLAAMTGDVLFLFVHQTYPADAMKQAALALALEVRRRLDPVLRERRRLVVLVWLRENGVPLDLDGRLPELEPFGDADLVANWLGGQLQETVSADDLRLCMDYLRRKVRAARGSPGATYQALTDVFNTLQGKPT
jgi:hypothetical protein